MDTLIFAGLLAVALIILRRPGRGLVLAGWAVVFIAASLLFVYHVSSALDLSF